MAVTIPVAGVCCGLNSRISLYITNIYIRAWRRNIALQQCLGKVELKKVAPIYSLLTTRYKLFHRFTKNVNQDELEITPVVLSLLL